MIETMLRWLSCVVLAVTFHVNVVAAQDEAILERRVREVGALVSADPKWSDDLFDPAFLAAVPPAKLRELGRGIFQQCGRVTATSLVQRESALAGKFEAVLEKGFAMPITIGLTASEPHSIVSLWFGAPAPSVGDWNAAALEIAKLPGSVSLGIYRVKREGDASVLEKIVEHEPDRVLAIGSAFKLYVIGALVREVEAERRKLEGTIALQKNWRSLPSGKLHAWPAGSPVTLHTLAALMISESDNTATDHLLFALGRERVEALLAPMGNTNAARNEPFLSTSEMFRLKLASGGKLAAEYVELTAAKRREFLAQRLPPLDGPEMAGASFTKPFEIERIEWFASARELCRAMVWLRDSTESVATRPLREVLAINPGLDVSRDAFPFVGFKGGSEPGVLNLTYLLQAQSGDWYALSCGWNDPAQSVDEARLVGLVTRMLALLAKETTSAGATK
ncbi:MAG: serine hydrolase [Planctomycetota bacterium]